MAAGGGVAPAEPAAGNAEGASRTQIAEVADTARTRWNTGLKVNLDLGKMGIAPWNRGKLGVSSFHVADVVHSITQDGLSRTRYHEVVVIRVPESALEEFKQFNREILAACPQLPPFSERMEYACLTKHLGFTSPLCHWLSLIMCWCVGRRLCWCVDRIVSCDCEFSFAQCLGFLCSARARRNHFVCALKLLQSGQAVANDKDKQLKRHLADGPLCQVLDEGFYTQDPEGRLPPLDLLL